MKEIKLTVRRKSKFSHLKLTTLVDDEDYDYLMQWSWTAVANDKHTFYAQKGDPIYRMHRLLLGITDPKVLVDHRDLNGLNNQRSNLRVATNAENARNKRAIGESAYLGVSAYKGKSNGRIYCYWRATISLDRKYISLGYFPFTPEGEIQAAKAYDEAAKKYFGEFANLNFK